MHEYSIKYLLTDWRLNTFLYTVAEGSGAVGELTRVVVTADGAVALDDGEAARPAKRVLR